MCDSLFNSRRPAENPYLPIINSNYFDTGPMESGSQNDPPMNYDSNRRSSLGAESLLEHDINEEAGSLEDRSDSILIEAQLGLEYADDIFRLNRYKERYNHPQRYIEEQPQVTDYMRCTLINWLIKVNHELRFGHETIFIAVSLTDRFLASTPIAQDCLQLLAVCALFVAAKLEESVVPGVNVLVSLCGCTYRPYHFRRMETLLLSTLRFELHTSTSWFFVTYFTLKSCNLAPLDRKTLSLSRYVIETCLGCYHISQFFPSEQAAAALAFSFLVLHSPSSVYPLVLPEDNHNMARQENENIFHILSGLTDSSSSLIWTFQDIFTPEEFKKINDCFDVMKNYMKPFLHSYSPNSGSHFFTINVLPSLKNNLYVEQEAEMNFAESDQTNFSPSFSSVYDEDKVSPNPVEMFEANSKHFTACKPELVKDHALFQRRSEDELMEGTVKESIFLERSKTQSMTVESNSVPESKLRNKRSGLLHSECNVT